MQCVGAFMNGIHGYQRFFTMLQLRELYAACLESDIHETDNFRKAFELLGYIFFPVLTLQSRPILHSVSNMECSAVLSCYHISFYFPFLKQVS